LRKFTKTGGKTIVLWKTVEKSVQVLAGTPEPGEQENDGGHCSPALSKGRQRERRCLFHNSIMGNFMVYQDRFETNLLQLFAQQEHSEWLSVISAIIFEVNNAAEHKQTYW